MCIHIRSNLHAYLFDHGQSNAILDGSTWILHLHLYEHVCCNAVIANDLEERIWMWVIVRTNIVQSSQASASQFQFSNSPKTVDRDTGKITFDKPRCRSWSRTTISVSMLNMFKWPGYYTRFICFVSPTLFNRTIGVFPMVSVTSFAHEGAAATGAALNARTLDTVRTARRVKVLSDMLLVYFLPQHNQNL